MMKPPVITPLNELIPDEDIEIWKYRKNTVDDYNNDASSMLPTLDESENEDEETEVHSSNKRAFDESGRWSSFSRLSIGDRQSESSLSWTDDEFENEITERVRTLFNDIDTFLYEDESKETTHTELTSELNIWKNRFVHLRVTGKSAKLHYSPMASHCNKEDHEEIFAIHQTDDEPADSCLDIIEDPMEKASFHRILSEMSSKRINSAHCERVKEISKDFSRRASSSIARVTQRLRRASSQGKRQISTPLVLDSYSTDNEDKIADVQVLKLVQPIYDDTQNDVLSLPNLRPVTSAPPVRDKGKSKIGISKSGFSRRKSLRQGYHNQGETERTLKNVFRESSDANEDSFLSTKSKNPINPIGIPKHPPRVASCIILPPIEVGSKRKTKQYSPKKCPLESGAMNRLTIQRRTFPDRSPFFRERAESSRMSTCKSLAANFEKGFSLYGTKLKKIGQYEDEENISTASTSPKKRVNSAKLKDPHSLIANLNTPIKNQHHSLFGWKSSNQNN